MFDMHYSQTNTPTQASPLQDIPFAHVAYGVCQLHQLAYHAVPTVLSRLKTRLHTVKNVSSTFASLTFPNGSAVAAI